MQVNNNYFRNTLNPKVILNSPDVTSICTVTLPLFAGLGILAPAATNFICTTNTLCLTTAGLIGACAVVGYLYSDTQKQAVEETKPAQGSSWYEIAMNYKAHQNYELFLSEAVNYGNQILNNNKYFNSDLDKTLTNALSINPIKLDDNHPILVLQAKNKAKPEVSPKSALKTFTKS